MSTDPRVVYNVREFDLGRDFYKRLLGFEETSVDFDERWATLSHGEMHIAITEGEPDPACGVAMIDVPDIKAETERLRADGVKVGTVIELSGELRLVDVFDHDGNRIQLSQPLE